MSDDFYSSMYGARPKAAVAPQVPNAPKPIPPAHRRLSGLKLSGQHMHEIELSNGTIGTIPTAAYVKLLEDQIKAFRQLLNQQSDDMRRANRAIQQLNRDMARLQSELDKTVKIR